jgi:hypothetical protein
MAHTVMPDIGGKRPSHRTIRSTASNITYGEQSIRMVKWLMCISRKSVMAQQLSASSKGYCEAMVVNLGKS